MERQGRNKIVKKLQEKEEGRRSRPSIYERQGRNKKAMQARKRRREHSEPYAIIHGIKRGMRRNEDNIVVSLGLSEEEEEETMRSNKRLRKRSRDTHDGRRL